MGFDGEQFPTQFSGEYPNTDEARRVALKDLTYQTRSRKSMGQGECTESSNEA